MNDPNNGVNFGVCDLHSGLQQQLEHIRSSMYPSGMAGRFTDGKYNVF
ncbi:hypothetical protein [Novosphingobium sp. Chol11]|nr:hypothetical protein [Novosphingobium sp. Chol11]